MALAATVRPASELTHAERHEAASKAQRASDKADETLSALGL
jgi:hypothetical protein